MADWGRSCFAEEACNGFDDDCDGLVDPAGSDGEITCHADTDGDGYGDPKASMEACVCDDGWTMDATECDDSEANAHPGAEEILYDGIDQDCLGLEGEYDRDGDGYDWSGGEGVVGLDCDDDDPAISPDAWDDCEDDIDQNCNGVVDECGLLELTTSDDA